MIVGIGFQGSDEISYFDSFSQVHVNNAVVSKGEYGGSNFQKVNEVGLTDKLPVPIYYIVCNRRDGTEFSIKTNLSVFVMNDEGRTIRVYSTLNKRMAPNKSEEDILK